MRIILVFSLLILNLSFIPSSTINNHFDHNEVTHSHHSHSEDIPCNSNTTESCSEHECCTLFVFKPLNNFKFTKNTSLKTFFNKSKILSLKLSEVFRPPIV